MAVYGYLIWSTSSCHSIWMDSVSKTTLHYTDQWPLCSTQRHECKLAHTSPEGSDYQDTPTHYYKRPVPLHYCNIQHDPICLQYKATSQQIGCSQLSNFLCLTRCLEGIDRWRSNSYYHGPGSWGWRGLGPLHQPRPRAGGIAASSAPVPFTQERLAATAPKILELIFENSQFWGVKETLN